MRRFAPLLVVVLAVPNLGLADGSSRVDAGVDGEQESRKLQAIPAPYVATDHLEPRIVGGSSVAKDTYPYFTLTTGYGTCGASLIHEDIVLCAAHCLEVVQGVAVGVNEVSSSLDPLDGEVRSVSYAVVHPDFVGVETGNDVLLLKLASPVLDKTPVTLATSGPNTGDALIVMGFGLLVEDGSSPTQLNAVDLLAISPDVCASAYAIIGTTIQTDLMFCAGVPQGGKDSCQGDSGGPIINESGEQVGIVSFGKGCGQRGYPGVYTKASAFTDWIAQKICEMSDNPPSSCPTFVKTPSTGGTVALRLDINYDNYPEENAWGVFTQAGDLVMRSSAVALSGSSSDPVDLLPGAYTFQMADASYDGICCDYGRGNITISSVSTGNVIAFDDGIFTDYLTLPFTVDGGSANSTSSSALKTVEVDIGYDAYPGDISWAIYDDVNSNEAFGPPSVGRAYQTDVEQVQLAQGTHTFVISDSFGDGLCCQYGNGYYKVSLVDVSTGARTVVASGASFKSSADASFTIS